MISWLLIAILSYFLFAVASSVDKFLLSGLIPNPKIYTFYAGILGILTLLLIPFVGLLLPDLSQLMISLLAGALYILAIFIMYKALYSFEVSRVIPAIGAFLPLFTFLLTYFFSQKKEIFSGTELAAFILLILGSVLIAFEKRKSVTRKSLQLAFVAAFLYALSFVLSKQVYTAEPFWSGFIWMRIGGFLMAACFLFSREVREELFAKKFTFQKKTAAIFISNQGLGASAFILLNWAIALAPLIYLAMINALGGIEYVFLLIFTVFLSLKFPKILKEELSGKILFQKILAILLIGAGLALITF